MVEKPGPPPTVVALLCGERNHPGFLQLPNQLGQDIFLLVAERFSGACIAEIVEHRFARQHVENVSQS